MAGFMVWTAPQKKLLELIEQFGALRENQAKAMIETLFPKAPWEILLFPLLSAHAVRRREDFLFSPTGKYCKETIEAIDVMLLLGANLGEPFFSAEKPFVLTFFKTREGKLWRYDICPVAVGEEIAVCALLENIGIKHRKVIFSVTEKEQMAELWIPCEHSFAIKQNEQYEFYKVEGNQDGF